MGGVGVDMMRGCAVVAGSVNVQSLARQAGLSLILIFDNASENYDSIRGGDD